MTTEKLNILQRLAAVQGELDYIQKEKKQGMNYSIVSHDKVTAAVRPLMVKHGIVYYPANLDVTQDGNRTQVKMDVIFANIDDRADFISVATLGYGIDAQDKGPGKAISYCVKYALLKTLSLETGDDPEHDQNAKHEPSPKAMPKAAARPEYARMSENIKVINDTGSLEDLRAFYKANIKTIESFDQGWQEQIMREFDDAVAALKAKAP